MARNRTRKKEKVFVPQGNAYVRATFNNTIITMTDNSGNVISQSSAGAKGFRGSRKSTAFAAQLAAQKLANQRKKHVAPAYNKGAYQYITLNDTKTIGR